MKPVWQLASILVVLALVLVIGVVGYFEQRAQVRAHHVTDQKLRDYCATVYAAIDMDADELASDKPKRQESAAQRFGELVTYHSEQEIALCAKERVDLSARGACQITHDYECLARLARGAADVLKPR